MLQINVDPGKGEFNFDQQALKLEYVPPASAGEVERATIQSWTRVRNKINLRTMYVLLYQDGDNTYVKTDTMYRYLRHSCRIGILYE